MIPTNAEQVLDNALQVKLKTDELIKQSDKLYLCMECGQVSDYYKFGLVCSECELKSLKYEGVNNG